jgi:hypothetical protein
VQACTTTIVTATIATASGANMGRCRYNGGWLCGDAYALRCRTSRRSTLSLEHARSQCFYGAAIGGGSSTRTLALRGSICAKRFWLRSKRTTPPPLGVGGALLKREVSGDEAKEDNSDDDDDDGVATEDRKLECADDAKEEEEIVAPPTLAVSRCAATIPPPIIPATKARAKSAPKNLSPDRKLHNPLERARLSRFFLLIPTFSLGWAFVLELFTKLDSL